MGAVPGGCLLTDEPTEAFEVEHFRNIDRPTAVIHRAERTMVVLGSTQPDGLVDLDQARRAGVEVRRRRGGGGAVLIVPGDTVWIDLWLPAGAAAWRPEPRQTAIQVGQRWSAALADAGAADLEVTAGRAGASDSTPARAGGNRLASVICFGGVGAGEVVLAGRKLVGLTQWRSRQGALVQGCTYRRFEPGPLLDVLAIDPAERPAIEVELAAAACGWSDAGVAEFAATQVIAHLGEADDWEVVSVD